MNVLLKRMVVSSALQRGGRLMLILSLCQLCGCGALQTVRLRTTTPPGLEKSVTMPEFPNVRAWGDDQASLKAMIDSQPEKSEPAIAGKAGVDVNTVDYLALSGGGGDGAYGAGLLCGWSRTGERPKFKVVTGISTGALMSPYAFLGPDFDDQLKACYTKISSKDIFKLNSLMRILFGESLATTEPLERLVKRYYSEEMIAAVAAEHLQGRRLYVATANLDAQRPVVWDMGAIACHAVAHRTNAVNGEPRVTTSFNPRAVALFRKVLIASASIPMAFPPQYFDVRVGERVFEEMHVDGGTINQVFICGVPMKNLASLDTNKHIRVFVIRNSKIAPDNKTVRPRIHEIGLRSISTLVKSQGVGSVVRIYEAIKDQPAEFHFAYIPDDIDTDRDDEFDPAIMRRLFDIGYVLAMHHYPWQHKPPGLEFATPDSAGSLPSKIK